MGIIIGRGGCVIRELQNKTQARIQIPSQPTPGQENRIATITGTQEGCQQAQSMIERIIMDQSSQSVMTGLAFTGTRAPVANTAAYYGQQQQQQPMYDMQQQQQQYGVVAAYGQQQQYPYAAQQQQKDYTAEWAAYYAAQAAAAAATTSATAADTTAAATTSAVPTDPTAYYNDFWKYAEYYGEEAARVYYGAWSPPIGSVNPNIAQKQQDQVANAASTAIQAKDTSVRNVSNLPAWMTNTSG